MHAVIETGGKQYRVKEGDVIFVEKLEVEAGEAVLFNKVLAVIDENDSANTTFGSPVVENATVEATALKNGKNKKVLIFKYKSKKGYRKHQGHRQPYTKVQVVKISV